MVVRAKGRSVLLENDRDAVTTELVCAPGLIVLSGILQRSLLLNIGWTLYYEVLLDTVTSKPSQRSAGVTAISPNSSGCHYRAVARTGYKSDVWFG